MFPWYAVDTKVYRQFHYCELYPLNHHHNSFCNPDSNPRYTPHIPLPLMSRFIMSNTYHCIKYLCTLLYPLAPNLFRKYNGTINPSRFPLDPLNLHHYQPLIPHTLTNLKFITNDFWPCTKPLVDHTEGIDSRPSSHASSPPPSCIYTKLFPSHPRIIKFSLLVNSNYIVG